MSGSYPTEPIPSVIANGRFGTQEPARLNDGNGRLGYRRLIRHRLAAEVDANKTPHRLRIIKRLFDRPVRQIEPALQEIDAQHPLDPDWWAAIARLRIERFDQPAQRRPRHNPLHLGQKDCPPRRLGVALKPRYRQCQLLHSPTHAHQYTPSKIIPRSLQLAFAE